MLGEIIKSTEALRYHAKSAEIAGQNLAHVNDESYARQRVLAKDGPMYKGQGGLSTSALSGNGLDHARNELLDKRVFSEFGDSASLEAQIQILKLLQASLGESINRSGIDGGLDLEHDSNLAEGGLARALDDLFNAFQELSSSPDEANAKQQIFQKIQTLTKRFNDAGNAIDEIETDIANTVESAVSSVNRLLDKVYEVNLQIKRFELLGQGKAVTYRDNRQRLLEDLSKLINFRTEAEISENGGRETGFINLYVDDTSGGRIELLSSANGVSNISKDFGNILELENQSGQNSKIRAKVSNNGSLGHIEVLDGGSQYDDIDGPILVSFTPSNNVKSVEEGKAVSDHKKGDVFRQDGLLYQALSDTLEGTDLNNESFMQISDLPVNGKVFPETLRRYSDLENFDKGELVFYQGKLFQAANAFGPTNALKVEADSPSIIAHDIVKGEVVEFNGNFFQAKTNLRSGTSVQGLDAQAFEVGEDVGGVLLALGNVPPSRVDDLNYVIQTISNDGVDRWFLGKSYQQGDIVKFEDKFFEVTQDIYRETEINELAALLQNDSEYAIGDEFGSFKSIASPSPNFLEENGSIYLSSNKKEFTISGLTGSIQNKQVNVNLGDSPFEFSLTVEGEEYEVSQTKPGSFIEQINGLRNSNGKQILTALSTEGSDIVVIKGKPGLSGDFELTNGQNNTAVVTTERGYLSDKFLFTIREVGTSFEADGETPVSVDLELDYFGSKSETNQALVDTINKNQDLSKIVRAEIKNGNVVITSLKNVDASYDIELLQGVSDDHSVELFPSSDPLKVDQITPPAVDTQQILSVNGFQGAASDADADSYDITINDITITVPSDGNEQTTVEAIVDAINSEPSFSDSVTASAKVNEDQSWELLITSKNKNVPDAVEINFNNSVADIASLNASSVTITAKGSNEIIQVVTYKATSIDFKRSVDTAEMTEEIIRFKQNEIYYQADDSSPSGFSHFVVTAPVDVSIDEMAEFDPTSEPWKKNFQSFNAKLLDPADPSTIIRKSYPIGHNLRNGNLVEVNVGLGEAVIKGGQVVGFNILNGGNGLPLTDSIFVEDKEVLLDSGSIKGYQNARSDYVETYRTQLNNLVSSFVEEINGVYNPEDQPGSYLFGFEAVLTRPVTGRNLLMEEEYGLSGREGDAYITLYRDEVDMTLPFAHSEEFSIVNTTPIYSEDFRGVSTVNLFRGGDVAETTFRADDAGDLFSFYGSAARMNYVTMENDLSYPGADLSPGTDDDGRSLMLAYEAIPFRIEGLEDGAKLPIIGDNFIFSALPSNPWNLASSLRIDNRLTSDSLLAGSSDFSGSNERAQAIAELGDGTFIQKVAILNAELGTGLGDLNDNLDHQKSIETLLLDQRRAVSSVSIDEEVADLMRFQRSFQASSRVLTTLDKMLEIIVMGLVR